MWWLWVKLQFVRFRLAAAIGQLCNYSDSNGGNNDADGRLQPYGESITGATEVIPYDSPAARRLWTATDLPDG